jgi:uncharacterized protein (UPF0332 family)
MSFQPSSFIKIAKELEAGTSEAHFRSVVNRAYYGALGYLKNNLPILSISPTIHNDVIRSLKNSPKLNEQKAGSILESLFKKRKDADYDYNIQFNSRYCSYSIKDAEKIIELFDQLDEE